MKQDELNTLIGKTLELNRDKKWAKLVTIFFSTMFLGVFGGDLFRFFYLHKFDFSLTLIFLGVILLSVVLIALASLAEDKNPPYCVLINSANLVITYKNGFRKCIGIADIEEVFVEVLHGKVSTAYLTIKSSDEKILVETICIDTVSKLVNYLKMKNIVVNYSNDLVKLDIETLSNSKTLGYKIFMIIFISFWCAFLSWLGWSCLFHYGFI